MNMHMSEQTRLLSQARDDRPEPSRLEPDNGHGRIFDLNGRVIDVRPTPADLCDLAHEPVEQVELVRGLIHEHTTPFRIPAPAPRVGLVIRSVTPVEHAHDTERRPADLSRDDCRLHARDRLEPAPLADNAE